MNSTNKNQISWANKLSNDELQKVMDVSANLGINPSWLTQVMYVETGGTFSPKIKNPSSSATGLIQFMEATAKTLGTTTKSLASMSFIQQMDYVEKYFRMIGKQLSSYRDVYLAVFYPAAIGKPDTWQFPKSIYSVNKGMDANKDGVIDLKDFDLWLKRGIPEFITQKKKK